MLQNGGFARSVVCCQNGATDSCSCVYLYCRMMDSLVFSGDNTSHSPALNPETLNPQQA